MNSSSSMVRACLLLLTLLSCSGNRSNGQHPQSSEKRITLLALTELKGYVAPCGCNSDPLGDLSRTTQLIQNTRANGPTIVIDGGSTLFEESPLNPRSADEYKLRSKVVANALSTEIAVEAVGVGPLDLANGVSDLLLTRTLTNITDAPFPSVPYKIVEVGGVKLGIVSSLSPSLTPSLSLLPPAASLAPVIKDLRSQNVDAVIGLLHQPYNEVRELLTALSQKGAALDLALLGYGSPNDPNEVETIKQVGNTWLFQPANRGQILSKLELEFRGGALQNAIGPKAAKEKISVLQKQLTTIEEQLESWKSQTGAEKFAEEKRTQAENLRVRIKALQDNPLQIPKTGSWFTFEQVRINKKLDCHSQVVSNVKAFSKKAGELNFAAAKQYKPTPAPKGTASFVGIETCEDCHDEAVEFWRSTRHAGAWETLTKLRKDKSYKCVSCHVTGWEKPGGSNLAYTENLQDVQCEVCHGPGSTHAQTNLKKDIQLSVPESLCTQCHNKDHSDTFNYEAYLRDITGDGHGAEFRKKLGDGPTGAKLRAEGLAKAGAEIGKGCPK